MGWANCGEDDLGRLIGYAHEATCDYSGCSTKIDRGLSYVCGGMHGGDGFGCGRYFCEAHRQSVETKVDRRLIGVCRACENILESEGCLVSDE
jgi:hypothetical protein